MIPKCRLQPKEIAQNLLHQSSFDHLCELFSVHGCVLVENAFSPAFIEQLNTAFSGKYRRFLTVPKGADHPDALRVGDRRWMVTIKVAPPFSNPQLYAHPLLYPWIEYLLGQECKIDSFGAVVSLPQAKKQHGHRDLPELFDDTPIDTQLPCYAITMMVPLIECNQHHGTTHLRPGSHIVSFEEAERMEECQPVLPVGSCLLMDYRLYHGGTANHSDRPRPLLYQVYTRPWFGDHRNFNKQNPLWLTHRSYNNMSKDHQRLFRTTHLSWF